MTKLLALFLAPPRAVLHGLSLGVCVGLVLAVWFSLARCFMLAYYWPNPGADLWAELPVALLMGFRFDLKMGAIAALLCSRCWFCHRNSGFGKFDITVRVDCE